MLPIHIIYISHGSKDQSTYKSLRISRKEEEGEENERTGIYKNYCCGYEVEVHCAYLSKEQESIDCDNGIAVHFLKDTNLHPVINKIDQGYVCIVPQGIVLTGNQWLGSLLFNYEHVNKSGVIGISSDTSKQAPTFLPDKEEGETIVFLPKDGIIGGLAFFSMKAYYHIGRLGDQLRGWEIPHFCIRSLKHGYENYYIDGEFALGIEPKGDSIGRVNMQESLHEMKEKRNWYLQ